MRTALYFGSFNPLHYGHIAVAKYIMENCDIDRFVMVLSPHNPFKKTKDLEEPVARLEALKKAVREFNSKERIQNKINGHILRLEVSDVEFIMKEPLYTYKTLKYLHKIEPVTHFTIVVGADSYEAMPHWYKGDKILEKYDIIVYPRKGSDVKELCEKNGATYLEDAPMENISSTEIREGKEKQGI
jgi:nicotinate-nucleotide adenylyltransferase